MVYTFFDKKTASLADKSIQSSGAAMLQNEKLVVELQKPIIKTFTKRRVYSSFKDYIWGAYLADIQLTSKFNKGTRFLLCFIDIQ